VCKGKNMPLQRAQSCVPSGSDDATSSSEEEPDIEYDARTLFDLNERQFGDIYRQLRNFCASLAPGIGDGMTQHKFISFIETHSTFV
jgi:hypothetical protein